jgi:hypothetical protein
LLGEKKTRSWLGAPPGPSVAPAPARVAIRRHVGHGSFGSLVRGDIEPGAFLVRSSTTVWGATIHLWSRRGPSASAVYGARFLLQERVAAASMATLPNGEELPCHLVRALTRVNATTSFIRAKNPSLRRGPNDIPLRSALKVRRVSLNSVYLASSSRFYRPKGSPSPSRSSKRRSPTLFVDATCSVEHKRAVERPLRSRFPLWPRFPISMLDAHRAVLAD